MALVHKNQRLRRRTTLDPYTSMFKHAAHIDNLPIIDNPPILDIQELEETLSILESKLKTIGIRL